MGVDVGDVDGDGRLDLFVANLDLETNTLYRQLGDGFFEDATRPTGLAAPSRERVGFGVALFDGDLDGDLDLYVANGHIIDNIGLYSDTITFRQPPGLFENLGSGRLEPAIAVAGRRWRAATSGGERCRLTTTTTGIRTF